MSTEPGAALAAGGRGWPDGVDLIELACVGSTLDEARARVPDIAGPTWIFAHRQTAGRGRRGRAWHAHEGNFTATLVLPDPGPPARAALRSFVAALALARALDGAGGDIALKWPNDVLLNGGKLAGILLEGLPGGGLAVGIGVNLASAPARDSVEADAVTPVSLARETGAQITPEGLLARLAPAFAGFEATFQTQGFGPIRRAWLMRAARLGEAITVRLPGETLTGVFTDVDEAGQLVLSTPDGPRLIAAGDVFF